MKQTQITADPGVHLNSILRRYMDLPKFLDLLHTRTLYFRRADGFMDGLEGALFPSFRKSLDDAFARKEVPHDGNYFYRRSRIGNYVSCWNLSPKDNMALWQLYGGVKTSIALTTTVKRLMSCGIAWNRPMHLHKVQYVDHRKVRNYVIGKFTDVLQYKSDAYRFEKELRVVLPHQEVGWEENPMGIRLALPSVDALVRSVVVAPEADSNYIEAVRELCGRYGLRVPVEPSPLTLVQV